MSAVGNFFKSAGKGLLASGGNPIAGLASGVLGAISESGKQGSITQNQNTTGTVNNQTSSQGVATNNGQFTNATKQVEDPLMTQFRQGLLPTFNQQIQRAQQPIFDDAHKAGFINQLNDLSDSSLKSIKSNLARSGGLNSGAATEALSGLETARFGNLASFFSQLPFQEAQAQAARVNPLLSMASTFAGHSPLDTIQTGAQTGQQTTANTGINNTQSQQQQTGETAQQGAPWWKNLLSNVGANNDLLSGSFGKLAEKFKPQTTTPGTVYDMWGVRTPKTF